MGFNLRGRGTMQKFYHVNVFMALWMLILTTSLFAKVQIVNDISKPIFVSTNMPEFTLNLPANETTGYKWVLDSDYNAKLIQPLKQHYHVINNKLIGSGGIDSWTFKVQSLGLRVPTKLALNLLYIRPWEKQPAKIVTLTIFTN